MPYYLERTDEKLAIQMLNFASKIEGYAATFGLNGTETAAMRADAAYFSWAVTNLEKIDTYKKNWTAFKTILLKGENGVATNTMPAPPALDNPPAVVSPGVLLRFTSLVNRIKAHLSYTSAIGQNLGIESTLLPLGIPLAEDKPALSLSVSGERVLVKWIKGRFTGVVIEKDSGSGFVLLDKDFMPDYIDPTPLPQGTSAIWRYRAIYLHGDEKAGQWSDVAAITVGGL